MSRESRTLLQVALFSVAISAAGLAAGVARAGEPAARPAQAHQPPRHAQGTPDCTCRAFGVQHSVGTEVCLKTPQGFARFRCGMDLNVTSWKPLEAPCPES